MSIEVFRSLADIQDAAPVELPGLGQRDAGGVVASRGPGRHRAVEFADDVAISDFRGLPSDVGGVLVGVGHDDQRSVGRREPAQPGGEHWPQWDGDRPTHMAFGEAVYRAGIDEDCAVGQLRPHCVHTQRC